LAEAEAEGEQQQLLAAEEEEQGQQEAVDTQRQGDGLRH